jgi:hypothetical protein
MAQYIIILKVEDAFYREFSEQGAKEEALMEQLKLDLQDQIDEYDLSRLMRCMVSSDSPNNMIIWAEKKEQEKEYWSQSLSVV